MSVPAQVDAQVGRVDDAPHHQLDYLAEVIRFRIVQELNAFDTNLTYNFRSKAPTGEQITYAADSNVFYFYINSFSPTEYEKAEALPNLKRRRSQAEQTEKAARRRRGRSSRRDSGISQAVITAEYLFSGHLPGQRGFPIYLDDAHAKEFQKRVSAILREITRDEVLLTDGENAALSRRADALGHRLSQLGSDPAGAKEQLKKLRRILDDELPDLIRRFRLEKIDRVVHLLHLMEGDVARPLRLAPGINRQLLDDEPDASLVGEWKNRLERYVPAELELRRESTAAADRILNRLADAKVLARFQLINEDCRRRNLRNRFVLITTSPAMLSASAFWLDERGGDLGGCFVRPLIQFIPILNFKGMPNFVERETAVERLRAACRGLFQWDRELSSDDEKRVLQHLDVYIRQRNRSTRDFEAAGEDGNLTERELKVFRMIDMQRLRSVFRWVDVENFESNLNGISELWSELVDNSIGLNSPLLVEHFRRHLGKISTALETLRANVQLSDALGNTYEHTQMSIADRLARVHLQMAARLMMGNLRPGVERHLGIVSGVRLQELLPDTATDAASRIVKALVAKSPEGAEDALMALTGDARLNVVEQNLAVAAAALRLGLWEDAESFAEHTAGMARDLVKAQDGQAAVLTERLQAEALWLAGLSGRAGIPRRLESPKQWRARALGRMRVARERQQAARELFTRHSDFVGRARSEAELAILAVGDLLLHLDDSAPLAPEKLGAAWKQGSEAQIMARGVYAEGASEADEERVLQRTRLLAGMAMVQLHLIGFLAGSDLPAQHARVLRKSLLEVDQDLTALGRENFDAWPLLLDIARALDGGDGPDQVEQLHRRFEEIAGAPADVSQIASETEMSLARWALERITEKRLSSPAG